MSIYCPLSEALGIMPGEKSILDFQDDTEYNVCNKMASEITTLWNQERVKDGTHPFLNSDLQRELAKRSNEKQMKKGTHKFLNPSFQSQVQKERFLKGTHHFQNMSKKTIDKRTNAVSRDWLVILPNGEKKKVRNLKKFCRDNDLSPSLMCLVSKGLRESHKGYRCERII